MSMTPQKTEWTDVAAEADLFEGAGIAVTPEGQDIALFKVEDGVYAINNLCTHGNAKLCDEIAAALDAGRSPVVAPMVGAGMVGSPPAIIRETRRGQAAFMAPRPVAPPGGSQSVRSSYEAGNDRGAKGCRKVDA
jgi:hypothetical protein